jgi:hypothetical protein
MDFPTRDGETETETATATETEPATYDGRHDEMETYWAVIDTERYIQKLCVSYDVAVDNGFARYNDAKGESPIADDGLFYYQTKQQMGDDLTEKRDEGELNSDQNLPNYKDQFGAPEFEHAEITAENAEDFGLDADLFDDDETIFLPDEYEPETDDDDVLIIWNKADGEYTKNDVLKALNGVKGIGDKKAGNALNALQDAGIVPSDL